VGVCSDYRIRVEESIVVENNSCEIFKVNLMNDTAARRNNGEVVEGLRSPF